MTMSFYCSDLCKGTQIQRIDKDLKTAKETLLMPKVITCFTSQYLRPKTCHKIQYSKIITSNTLVSRKIHGINGINKIGHSCEKETILQAKLLQERPVTHDSQLFLHDFSESSTRKVAILAKSTQKRC